MLVTISANVIDRLRVAISLISRQLGVDGIVDSERISSVIKVGFKDFCLEI
ncbi:MAG: hypothetical protein ACJA2D_000365 [Pseudohongiellaceae bacterium]